MTYVRRRTVLWVLLILLSPAVFGNVESVEFSTELVLSERDTPIEPHSEQLRVGDSLSTCTSYSVQGIGDTCDPIKTPNKCASSLECREKDLVCILPEEGAECEKAADCGTGFRCRSRRCVIIRFPQDACGSNEDCAGYACIEGTCVGLPVGAECTPSATNQCGAGLFCNKTSRKCANSLKRGEECCLSFGWNNTLEDGGESLWVNTRSVCQPGLICDHLLHKTNHKLYCSICSPEQGGLRGETCLGGNICAPPLGCSLHAWWQHPVQRICDLTYDKSCDDTFDCGYGQYCDCNAEPVKKCASYGNLVNCYEKYLTAFYCRNMSSCGLSRPTMGSCMMENCANELSDYYSCLSYGQDRFVVPFMPFENDARRLFATLPVLLYLLL